MTARRSGTVGFIDDIARWRKGVGSRAPAYHRLLQELVELLAANTREGAALAERLADAWRTRSFGIFYDRPLLFLAALRMDALVQGSNSPLWSGLAAPEPDLSTITRDALLEALQSDAVWQSVRTRFVQTNETSRAVAWLWPAQIIGCSDGARPLALFEVGTAAGLNLVADRLPCPWTIASGALLPTVHEPDTVARLGIDAHPLDACNDSDANWLRACVWPGETARSARLEAAIAAFRASPAELERADVSEAPTKLGALSERHSGRSVVLAFQTIVRDYLDEQTRAAYEQGMRGWLDAAPTASALWVELEIHHDDPQKGVPIVVHARDASGRVEITLATTSFHPEEVRVDDAAVERLQRMFR